MPSIYAALSASVVSEDAQIIEAPGLPLCQKYDKISVPVIELEIFLWTFPSYLPAPSKFPVT